MLQKQRVDHRKPVCGGCTGRSDRRAGGGTSAHSLLSAWPGHATVHCRAGTAYGRGGDARQPHSLITDLRDPKRHWCPILQVRKPAQRWTCQR